MPIILAICSMLCASVNDFIFKLYARKDRPVGLYVAIIGVVWAGLFAYVAGWESISHASKVTLFWGIISGLFSVVANILLIEAMSNQEVGVCATIYRLNLAPAALLAFLLLGENISLFKLLGIGAALVGIILVSWPGAGKSAFHISSGLFVLLIAGLCRAFMGISYKYSLSQGADYYVILVLNGTIWTFGGALYLFLTYKSTSQKFVLKTTLYGLLSGILVCGIVFFMISAMRKGDASTVLPIAQLSFLITSLIGILFLRELCTLRKILGLVFALLCILFMAMDRILTGEL